MLRVVAFMVVTALAQLAWGQATVDESQESVIYWVDASNGSDSNPGTQAAPFQTIAKAAAAAEANNQAGIGTQVNVNPGTYRESVAIASTPADTAAPITIQAVTPGTAALSGADVFGGWLPYNGTAVYSNAWPYQYGLCSADNGPAPFEEDIVLRRELFVINGRVLTQVLALGQMQPGTYFVDEAGAQAYIWPPSGTDMSTATVEVATRPELLSIAGKSNMVVRGLTFEYAGSCRLDSAVPITAASNILLDGNSFSWNNSLGVSLSNVSYVTEQNNVANHNGNGGLADYETLHGYFSNNVTNYNNWRGAQGGYYRWSAAGFHPYANHISTIVGLVSAYNQAYGVHWDTDNQNITADSMILSENLLAEGFIEKSEGPLTISNSYMCNGNPNTGPVFLGFELRNSSNVTFTGNTWSNDQAASEIVDATGGVPVTDWQTGQLYSLSTQNISSSGNNFVNGSNQFVFYDGGANWSLFTPTLMSDYNNWWNPSDSTPFFTPNSSGGYSQLDLPGWQGVTGQDAHSTAVQPSSTYADKCYVPPEAPDFWLVVDPLKNQLDVTSGNSIAFATTVSAFGGFTGVVSLVSDGVQYMPGATATWSTPTINTSGTATLTVQTSAATPTGVYPITMVANSGDITRTLTGTVLVNTTLGIDPLVANLGSVKLGSTSAKFIVVVNNFSTTTAIAINSIAATGDFSQTNTCGNSLAASTACAVTIAFTPTTVGTRTGSLVFSTSDPGSPQTVALQGVGLGVPVLTLTPSSVVFPDTDVKTASQPSTVLLTNAGTVTLNISSISIGGQNQGDFSQTSGCTAPLPPGSSCNVSVVFSPVYLGSRTANLSIASDASTLPQTAGMSGNGVAPVVTVSAANLTFGTQPLGLTSAALKSTLTNSGNGPLFISGIVLGGTSPGDFAQTNDCPISPASLAIGAACTLTVTFTPT
ncbi:MAG: choice-of-anchor D domain-containing protein, partial [Acidobacteriales bacterium]|nr:choice-of-anchor D domain-containing protein [Terriglobales bacterium]